MAQAKLAFYVCGELQPIVPLLLIDDVVKPGVPLHFTTKALKNG